MMKTVSALAASCSAASSEPASSAPGAAKSACRLITMLRRPGRGRKRGGSDSQVLRPMITVWPLVSALKWAMSSGMFQISVLSLPITRFLATAAMMTISAMGSVPEVAEMFDQSACRVIEVGAVGFATDAWRQFAGQLLAQLDTPLVEGVEVPQHPKAEHLVLVEGDKLAEGERAQLRHDDGGRWLVARETAEGQQVVGNARLAGFFDGLAEGEGRRLRQAVGKQAAVVAGERKIRAAEGDEVAGDQRAALVQ